MSDCTEPDALLAAPPAGSLGDGHKHSLSDLLHVAHRGLSSSHFTLLRLQVRLSVLASDQLYTLHAAADRASELHHGVRQDNTC